ncbi:hypothetical protein ILUMI_26171 [Ignelater luminosus]|uniref:Uncharacterized protein n=1 Tax=Ignelater luminosus TaxID=2038154 RepID=A0A8K0C4L1_IGNLU|nr:hypothetical protein ILUMI_26171 [Ignelater luminosus]
MGLIGQGAVGPHILPPRLNAANFVDFLENNLLYLLTIFRTPLEETKTCGPVAQPPRKSRLKPIGLLLMGYVEDSSLQRRNPSRTGVNSTNT